MRVLRNLLLLVFLAGLVAFNVSFGLQRFEWRREAWATLLRERAAGVLAELQVAVERELAALEARAAEGAGDARAASGGARRRVAADGGWELGWCLDADGGEACAWSSTELAARLRDAAGALPGQAALRAGTGADAALLGDAAAFADDGARLTRGLRGAPDWTLAVRLPPEALVPPADWRRGEALATVATMVGVSLGLIFAGAVFLRLSTRSFRLRETERYLSWIRRLSDRYRALMEGAADMILVVDPASGRLRETNVAARAALGLPEGADAPGEAPGAAAARDAEPPGPSLEELFAGDDLRRVREALDRAVARAGSPEALPELRVRGPRGVELLVDGRVAVVDVGDAHIAQLSLRDISEQKEIERRLQTNERLSSLGLLTAGVAHEINNPLEGIGNYVKLLEADGLPPERRAQYLGAVRHGFERIRDIVRDLLHFSRGEAGRGRVDLEQVVQRALSMAAYSKLFADVDVVREVAPGAGPVLGDAGRLEQVLLNLLLNAARASGGGRVWVRLGPAPGDPSRVQLEVADEGPGIPEELRDRIFDPFFTTEGGTGLGLSVSYGIIKAHGGVLSAHAGPQGGAVFRVVLPRDDDAARAAPAQASADHDPRTADP